MPAEDELRARFDAAWAEYDAARQAYEAWNPPPQLPDATPEDYQAYEQVRLADHQTWLRAEGAWYELDVKLHPDAHPEIQSPHAEPAALPADSPAREIPGPEPEADPEPGLSF